MFISTALQNTQSGRSTKNTPTPVSLQERIASIISEIETFQTEFAKITNHINTLADQKESHQAALKNTDYSNSYANALLQECINHKQEETNIQVVINALSHEKQHLKKILQNAKIEISRCIDEMETLENGAGNEKEIKYLLSAANHKIAAADFSIGADDLNHAKMALSRIKYLPEVSTENSIHFPVKLMEIIHNQTELYLKEEKTKLHQLETVMQQTESAMEKAKWAWEECISNAALQDSADDELLTPPAAPTMPVDTLAIDEAQDYEPVIATGMDEHLELI